MTPRRRRALLAIGCLVAGVAVARDKPWTAEPLDEEAVASVWTHIEHQDCPGAVKALNAGVARRYPGTLLLAGAMFEGGVCLKPEWSKAATFYEQAHAAGHPRAASRLASGYLTAAAGPDKAAGLWWAMQAGTALPAECSAIKPLVDDPDRFVAALRAWPAGRLDACSYVAGVAATLGGDLEFSSRASAHGLRGAINTHFWPAEGRFEIATDELGFVQLGGVASGDAMLDRESSAVKMEFERDIRAAADRALARYPKPRGIDPAWRVTIAFSFGYVLR